MYQCALTNHMAFHYRTGNKKFGKKNHRDEGLLVEELVKERLDSEQSIHTGISGISFNKPNSPIKMDNFLVNQDGNITVDDAIGLQEETLSSNVNVNCEPSGSFASVMAASADQHFPDKVIEPRIDLRNSEQDPSYLTTIYQKDDSGSLIIRCASCYHHFPSHTELLRHRKEYHNDGKPYQCNFCTRTFSVAANLRQHQSIHNTKRKYSCTECGKSYKVTQKLREHLKFKHAVSTEHLTDLDLNLKYGLSFKNELQSSSTYMSQGMPINNSTTAGAKIVGCESDIEPYEISKVANGVLYLDAKNDLPSTVSVNEICADSDVSFIINITNIAITNNINNTN